MLPRQFEAVLTCTCKPPTQCSVHRHDSASIAGSLHRVLQRTRRTIPAVKQVSVSLWIAYDLISLNLEFFIFFIFFNFFFYFFFLLCALYREKHVQRKWESASQLQEWRVSRAWVALSVTRFRYISFAACSVGPHVPHTCCCSAHSTDKTLWSWIIAFALGYWITNFANSGRCINVL